MTAGERLVALAGQGGTAAALLLAIGIGATTGAALVEYSGLPAGTAAEHLLTDVAVAPPPVVISGGTSYGGGPRRRRHPMPVLLPELRPAPIEEEEALMMTGLL